MQVRDKPGQETARSRRSRVLPQDAAVPEAQVYQLRVSLCDVRPLIWRQLLVRGDTTMAALHKVLQIAMGWEDYHLHRFVLQGEGYSVPEAGEIMTGGDARAVTLSRIGLKAGDRFFYEYDFGDSWEHDIVVEKVLKPEPKDRYPVCTDGRRACPPEDCGGPPGYQEILQTLKKPFSRWRQELREWLKPSFDPGTFRRGEVNASLRAYFSPKPLKLRAI